MHAFAAIALFIGAATAVPDIYNFKYSADNVVQLATSPVSLNELCLIAPRNAHTPIGVAEGSGTKTYCTAKTRWDKSKQGQLPSNFFSDARGEEYTSKTTKGLVRQITGCIHASGFDRLDPKDEGGQFDSSGQGNDGVPSQSFCILGPNNKRGFYVQQFEPAENRFCLRCCEKNSDCNHTLDTKGCKVAIPGYYGDSCK